MTYRVIIDFGQVELKAMIWSETPDPVNIYEKALDHLNDEGWLLPPEYPVITIEAAPEWDDEQAV